MQFDELGCDAAVAIRVFGERFVVVGLLAALSCGVVSGCSSKGADVSCTTTACTVTLDRGVDAKASVLGIEVKLDDVQNNQATIDVNGSKITMPVGGSPQASGGGVNVGVKSITDSQVVLQVMKD